MADLTLKFRKTKFQNPFILASGPATRNAEMISSAFDVGWAAAVTKTICLNYEEMASISPRFYSYKTENNLAGLQNLELISDRSPKDWVEDIKYLKNNYPDRVIIASISAEAYNYADWQSLAIRMQDAGADILELNLSCPHGLPEKSMGSACCNLPDLPVSITAAVKNVINIPVWVKLSSDYNDIGRLVEFCLLAGADGITAINTVKGFSGIDIETGYPNFNIDGNSTFGGFSGSIIKPIALRCVAEVAKTNKCFVSGSGGINSWEDAVEFMLLGASTVQICTKVMIEGVDIVNSMISGLADYLERHNYESVRDIIGKSLNKISNFENLNKNSKAFPKIDKETCIKCGKCFISCRDAGYQAINFSVDNLPEINLKNCTGCGLCGIVCPVSAISNSLVHLQNKS